MNIRTRPSVRASAWQYELFILLADRDAKRTHSRWEKGFPAELKSDADFAVGTQFSQDLHSQEPGNELLTAMKFRELIGFKDRLS